MESWANKGFIWILQIFYEYPWREWGTQNDALVSCNTNLLEWKKRGRREIECKVCDCFLLSYKMMNYTLTLSKLQLQPGFQGEPDLEASASIASSKKPNNKAKKSKSKAVIIRHVENDDLYDAHTPKDSKSFDPPSPSSQWVTACWNIRGFNATSKQLALGSLAKRRSTQMVGILETLGYCPRIIPRMG